MIWTNKEPFVPAVGRVDAPEWGVNGSDDGGTDSHTSVGWSVAAGLCKTLWREYKTDEEVDGM